MVSGKSATLAVLAAFVCFTATAAGPRTARPVGGDEKPLEAGLHGPATPDPRALHREVPDDPWMPRSKVPPPGAREHRGAWSFGRFDSIQVNVSALGGNILGDAANEPSIAIDPTGRVVIGWRQFDTVGSNFRQAGWAYSHDGGQTWTFPGVIEPGIFRSDPVLGADTQGNIFYNSLTIEGDNDFLCDVFKSTDGGLSWDSGTYAHGGDKQWMAIDRTNGIGQDNIYAYWTQFWSICPPGHFTRSYDGGNTFLPCTEIPDNPNWGTLDVGPDGELYITGDGFVVAKSTTMQDEALPAAFDFSTWVDLGGGLSGWAGPNPSGLLGQAWIATDHSDGPTRGNVYLLASIDPAGSDPLDVMFARSSDGGTTWTAPVRVNDDPTNNGAWQWFGTMAVAPNSRIDVVWNDTRNTGLENWSQLFYAYSTDAGDTWSENIPVSQQFNSHIGWPQQNKIGDYYDMISDDTGVNIAYAATFNGEQDVYFLRIVVDCNGNGVPDVEDIANGDSDDLNDNGIPDECETTVPAVSAWAALAMALLMLAAGTLVLRRKSGTVTGVVST